MWIKIVIHRVWRIKHTYDSRFRRYEATIFASCPQFHRLTGSSVIRAVLLWETLWKNFCVVELNTDLISSEIKNLTFRRERPYNGAWCLS